MLLPATLNGAEATPDAEASFNYISSSLQTIRSSGFNSESAMCRFYRDPENARMTIEERAELSKLYLRSPEARAEQFETTNREFLLALEARFGADVLQAINATKLESVSNQRLPSSSFDEAATISFLDAMCG